MYSVLQQCQAYIRRFNSAMNMMMLVILMMVMMSMCKAKIYKWEACLDMLAELSSAEDRFSMANCQPCGRWPVLFQVAHQGAAEGVPVMRRLISMGANPHMTNLEGHSCIVIITIIIIIILDIINIIT